MDAVLRATCPGCKSSLKIPAQWAGQPVKCKKCGAVVRTKAGPAPSAVSQDTATHIPQPETNGHAAPAAAYPAPPATAVPQAPQPVLYPQPVPANYAYPAPAAYQPPVPPGYAYPAPAYGANGQGAPPYPYPAPAAAPAFAPPAAQLLDLDPTEPASPNPGRGKYRRGSGRGKFIWIGVALVLTAGLAVAGLFFGQIRDKVNRIIAQTTGQNGENVEPKENTPQSQLLSYSGPYPRRLLFMHVSNYLYLNPLTNASVKNGARGPDRTRAAALRLAYEWRVPTAAENNQVFVLSDTAPPPDNRPPMKGVITGTYERFFETSRPQDRIVIYFGGHVVIREKDGAETAFIVPMEGDPEEMDSLIPLADFYGKLKECKASQKVVIWDVCRYNPDRGRVRPGSEPMTEGIAKALAAAPAGVQVITTCQPGENALEFYSLQPDGNGKPAVVGSNFLEAGLNIASKQAKSVKNLDPNDPIPIVDWSKSIGDRVSFVASQALGSLKQTVKVSGALPASLVAYNKEEAPPPHFDIPAAPKGASPDVVARIAGEFALPGIKEEEDISAVATFPFPEASLADYKEDVPLTEIMNPANEQKYFFRRKVLEAFERIRTVWGKDGAKLRKEFVGETSDAVKKEILNEQLFPAEAIPNLELAITLLEAVADQKDLQPKRWQAHYDYALAQCKSRLAFMHEYNLALGSIRTEVLPALDPKQGHDGYKLISAEKMKVKEKSYAEEAKEIFDAMIEDYRGTPWAVQAKRDRVLSLGLAWQPFNSKAEAENNAIPMP